MLKLEVFDPPMCCSTGICGSSIDPTLVTFASDLEWLKKQGVEVLRHGLSFEPAEFVKNEYVKNIINSEGNSSLPILVIDGKFVTKGHYPSREKLAEFCQIDFNVDEAPPIHREENCCCGEDCDCSITHHSMNDTTDDKCDCTNAAAEDNCMCGANCDCHKSAVSDNLKKVIFVIVILLMLGIVAAKFWGKAGAATINTSTITCDSIDSLNQISKTQDVAFVYLAKSGEDITLATKKTMSLARKTLNSKKINTAIYSMNTKSIEYYQLSARTKLPAILTVVKGKGSSFVTAPITQTRLLQSYLEVAHGGSCPTNCPCHK